MSMMRKWIQTNENWCPTFKAYETNASIEFCNPMPWPAVSVELIFLRPFSFLPNHPLPMYRVLISGADDTGYEKDFEDPDEAVECYDKVVNFTTMLQLQEQGFVHM